MRQRDKAILTGQRQIVFINTREKEGAVRPFSDKRT